MASQLMDTHRLNSLESHGIAQVCNFIKQIPHNHQQEKIKTSNTKDRLVYIYISCMHKNAYKIKVRLIAHTILRWPTKETLACTEVCFCKKTGIKIK